jgi:hypothetical protein
MRFARWVFLLAGLLGLVLIVPPFFLERKLGEDYPPPINHPENYYGFLSVTLAWQVLYLVIASDPVRLRPAMPVAVLAKAAFVMSIAVLYALERVGAILLGFAAFDAACAVLFVVAYLRTPKKPSQTSPSPGDSPNSF